MITKYGLICDPDDILFPGHNVHGRIGVLAEQQTKYKLKIYKQIRIEWRQGDKYRGRFITLPYIGYNFDFSHCIIPVSSKVVTSKLLKIMNS